MSPVNVLYFFWFSTPGPNQYSVGSNIPLPPPGVLSGQSHSFPRLRCLCSYEPICDYLFTSTEGAIVNIKWNIKNESTLKSSKYLLNLYLFWNFGAVRNFEGLTWEVRLSAKYAIERSSEDFNYFCFTFPIFVDGVGYILFISPPSGWQWIYRWKWTRCSTEGSVWEE